MFIILFLIILIYFFNYPDKRAALAIKYGGNSPRAVPAPQHIASSRTLDIILNIVTESGSRSDGQIILNKKFINRIVCKWRNFKKNLLVWIGWLWKIQTFTLIRRHCNLSYMRAQI